MTTLRLLRVMQAAALLALAGSSVAIATTHTVSNQVELNTAISAAAPGDSIVIANNTYSGLYLNLTCNGTSTDLITIRAATPGGVTLVGDSRVRIAGSYLVVHGLRFEDVLPATGSNVVSFSRASHSRLTQCYFLRCGKGKWVHIVSLTNESKFNRLDHNTWEDIKGQGLGITDETASTDNRIDHNRFNRTGAPNQGNGNEPIQLGQGGVDADVMRATVEYNLIENMRAADGADPELISVKTAENIIRFNTCRNNDADREITLRDAQNCIVEGNFIFGSGIRAFGGGHKIINNYIVNSRRGINIPGADGTDYPAVSGMLIANNTIINPTTSGISLRTASGPMISGITLKNNLVQGGVVGSILYEHTAGITGCSYATNLGYSSGGATVSSGSAVVAITTNPNLINDGIIDRLPSTASPAKSAGTATPEIVFDVDGQPRIGTLDIGADEYASALVVRFPLLTSDVGPAWLGGPAEADGVAGTKVAVPGSAVMASADDGNVPANTVDSNLGTRWSGELDGTWLRFDLGATYTVTHLKVAVHQGDARQTGFHLQLSDNGSTWTDVGGTTSRPLVSSGTTLSHELYDTPDARGRYVRLVGHGNSVNLWNSLTEVEVYGHSPSLTAVADSYVAGGSPNTIYGTAATLGAKDTTGTTYDRIAYIKFDLSKLTFTPANATLVFTSDVTTEAGTVTVNQCTTDSWTEAALNWNNRPAIGTGFGTQAVAGGTVADLTMVVSSYVNSQYSGDPTKLVTFALTGNNAVLMFKSRETGSTDAPTLLLAP